MARKREITGQVVLYTTEGTHVVDAEVRHNFNAHGSFLRTKNFKQPEKSLLVAMARTVPTDNVHAAQPCRQTIDSAAEYTKTKFFRLLLKLMELAQFEPVHPKNFCFARHDLENLRLPNLPIGANTLPKNFDWTADADGLDAQFFKLFDFTPALIRFTEAHFR